MIHVGAPGRAWYKKDNLFSKSLPKISAVDHCWPPLTCSTPGWYDSLCSPNHLRIPTLALPTPAG